MVDQLHGKHCVTEIGQFAICKRALAVYKSPVMGIIWCGLHFSVENKTVILNEKLKEKRETERETGDRQKPRKRVNLHSD